MRKIIIHYEEKPIYPIVLSDSFNDLSVELDLLGLKDKKVCIVTDHHVAPLYLEEVKAICKEHCKMVSQFIFEAGEENKTLDTVQNLYEHLIVHKFERRDMLIALGGGVVGDLTGYTAATYLRGISFIQIPTSLLSQVDSSIGGKTGVDFRAYKNMVGAFHQPKLVYSNVSVLKTLTRQQYCSGMGEIIKHGLIKDRGYYEWLKENKADILHMEPETLMDMIQRSDEIKQHVVENDPFEKGERALLNFGHTLGHAVEKLMDFSMLHGECVAIGMQAAAFLSYKKQMITLEEYKDIVATIQAFELPITVTGISKEDIISVSKSDKKMDKGRVKFILLEKIGQAVVDHHIDDTQLLVTAQKCLED